MKIFDVINAKNILDDISQNKEIPTKIAYKIYLMLSKLSPSLKFFEQKRSEAFEKYGVQEGETIIIPAEYKEEFMSLLNEIGEFECEEEIEKIDINLDINLGISPSDFALLEPFFNFVE
ncbi:MAG: hypothetical protein IJA34_01025 [Lachnospiraceae bacterium]|nr:hypothetical protein [Lachnospiraceae bacterium]